MNATNHLLLCIFLFLALPNAPTYAELKINAPRASAQLHEPVFVTFAGTFDKPHSHHFLLSINGEILTDANAEVLGLDMVKSSTLADGRETVSASWTFFYNFYQRQPLLEKSGDYILQVLDRTTKEASNELRITIHPPMGRNSAAVRLWMGLQQMVVVATDEESPEGVKELGRLLNQFPDSAYAPYAALALLKRDFKASRSTLPNSKEHQLQIDAAVGKLAGRYLASSEIPQPSKWHAEALWILAQCQCLNGDYTSGMRNVESLIRTYPESPWSVKAEKLGAEINRVFNRAP
jgi:hypothetical protein